MHWKEQAGLLYKEAVDLKSKEKETVKNEFDDSINQNYFEWDKRESARAQLQANYLHLLYDGLTSPKSFSCEISLVFAQMEVG